MGNEDRRINKETLTRETVRQGKKHKTQTD